MNAQESGSLCPVCSEKEPAAGVCPHVRSGCPLRELPDGARSRVRVVRCGQGLRSRLYSLGFVPGTEIMMNGHGDAGCRVQVRDTCVVLDCESADSILCDAADEAGAPSCPSRTGVPGRFFDRFRHGREGGNHD